MSIYLAALLVCLVFYGILFLVAEQRNKPALGDHFWGIGFIVVTLSCLGYRAAGNVVGMSWQATTLCNNQPLKFITDCTDRPLTLSGDPLTYVPALVVSVLVILWAIRISRHTLVRNKNNALDWRYANWRALRRGENPRTIFFEKYLLQAGLLWLVSLPMIFLYTIEFERDNYRDSLIYGPVLIGLGIWLFGFIFEAISDWQLQKFNKHKANRGQILQHGLWKFSRHPNYFGEVTMWWGIFFVTLAAPLPTLWLMVSPLIITYMIRYVSGVPVLEKLYKDNKAYQEYKRHTNTLLPWFRKA